MIQDEKIPSGEVDGGYYQQTDDRGTQYTIYIDMEDRAVCAKQIQMKFKRKKVEENPDS